MNLSASTFADTGHFYEPVNPDTDAGQAQTRPLLVFHLGDRVYGLAVEHVVQIIAMIKLTPVPQSEQVIEGVANIRGKIVPVLSARRHLGLPLLDPQLYTPIILLRAGEKTIGLIVDEVADVIRLPISQVTDAGTVLPEEYQNTGVLDGVVHHGDEVIMLINPRYLLNPTQLRAFRQSTNPPLQPGNSLFEVEPENAVSLPAEPAPAPNGGARKKKAPEVNLPEASLPQASLPETRTPAVKANPAAGKPSPSNGHGKSRKGRRNVDQRVAGEIAGLAADLPPSDGKQMDEDTSDIDQEPAA